MPIGPPQERLWPEEKICGCNHGECSICLAVSTLQEMAAMGSSARCHHPPLDCCFVCNVIERQKLRERGQTVPPPH